jgi:hypothetical protein
MNYPKVLYQLKQCAGQTFMPSNGTEGMIFVDAFCERCVHEKFSHTHNECDKKCDIFTRSMIEDEVPEWVYSEEGWPICTAWVPWDWNKNDDDDNWNDPPPGPDPVDPMQLNLFPLYPDEQNYNYKKKNCPDSSPAIADRVSIGRNYSDRDDR